MSSTEKVTNLIKEFVMKQSNDSFNAGAMSVIITLRETMKVTGLSFVPSSWLDFAEREIKKNGQN